jgi:hypothetical protein
MFQQLELDLIVRVLPWHKIQACLGTYEVVDAPAISLITWVLFAAAWTLAAIQISRLLWRWRKTTDALLTCAGAIGLVIFTAAGSLTLRQMSKGLTPSHHSRCWTDDGQMNVRAGDGSLATSPHE